MFIQDPETHYLFAFKFNFSSLRPGAYALWWSGPDNVKPTVPSSGCIPKMVLLGQDQSDVRMAYGYSGEAVRLS